MGNTDRTTGFMAFAGAVSYSSMTRRTACNNKNTLSVRSLFLTPICKDPFSETTAVHSVNIKMEPQQEVAADYLRLYDNQVNMGNNCNDEVKSRDNCNDEVKSRNNCNDEGKSRNNCNYEVKSRNNCNYEVKSRNNCNDDEVKSRNNCNDDEVKSRNNSIPKQEDDDDKGWIHIDRTQKKEHASVKRNAFKKSSRKGRPSGRYGQLGGNDYGQKPWNNMKNDGSETKNVFSQRAGNRNTVAKNRQKYAASTEKKPAEAVEPKKITSGTVETKTIYLPASLEATVHVPGGLISYSSMLKNKLPLASEKPIQDNVVSHEGSSKTCNNSHTKTEEIKPKNMKYLPTEVTSTLTENNVNFNTTLTENGINTKTVCIKESGGGGNANTKLAEHGVNMKTIRKENCTNVNETQKENCGAINSTPKLNGGDVATTQKENANTKLAKREKPASSEETSDISSTNGADQQQQRPKKKRRRRKANAPVKINPESAPATGNECTTKSTKAQPDSLKIDVPNVWLLPKMKEAVFNTTEILNAVEFPMMKDHGKRKGSSDCCSKTAVKSLLDGSTDVSSHQECMQTTGDPMDSIGEGYVYKDFIWNPEATEFCVQPMTDAYSVVGALLSADHVPSIAAHSFGGATSAMSYGLPPPAAAGAPLNPCAVEFTPQHPFYQPQHYYPHPDSSKCYYNHMQLPPFMVDEPEVSHVAGASAVIAGSDEGSQQRPHDEENLTLKPQEYENNNSAHYINQNNPLLAFNASISLDEYFQQPTMYQQPFVGVHNNNWSLGSDFAAVPLPRCVISSGVPVAASIPQMNPSNQESTGNATDTSTSGEGDESSLALPVPISEVGPSNEEMYVSPTNQEPPVDLSNDKPLVNKDTHPQASAPNASSEGETLAPQIDKSETDTNEQTESSGTHSAYVSTEADESLLPPASSGETGRSPTSYIRLPRWPMNLTANSFLRGLSFD